MGSAGTARQAAGCAVRRCALCCTALCCAVVLTTWARVARVWFTAPFVFSCCSAGCADLVSAVFFKGAELKQQHKADWWCAWFSCEVACRPLIALSSSTCTGCSRCKQFSAWGCSSSSRMAVFFVRDAMGGALLCTLHVMVCLLACEPVAVVVQRWQCCYVFCATTWHPAF
jgi:hypothetical protein